MSYPKNTFELRLSFAPSDQKACLVKTTVIEWLSSHGIDEFVEGVMDGLDIDHEYTGPSTRDFYEELGGDMLPISIYKYNRELLEDVRAQILRDFPSGLTAEIHSMETSEWLEGWKESFKPIETASFYIYPPWNDKSIPASKIPIIVEPGMAFGTGQHATTQVVLRCLEAFASNNSSLRNLRFMDVGTGTGILALAALRLGFYSVAASDIDPDAVMSAENNGRLNHLDLALWQGSCPVSGVPGRPQFDPPFDVVVANILFVVLRNIIGDLAKITRVGGRLILSGVLIEDAAEMTVLAEAEGLKLTDKSELEGWACLTFTK
jgi:ribosomal protein L11 methyltransferase